ncbi:transcription termination/antitermination protein NusG [Capsulimonas corticalis]|uniref:Transcription termination/antitermination protein NusG n=1 Tax=Capsulimonas corticalis TaxID=2219043 RepID=A0A402CNY8_9BACT|nr:transcription termination/antitermination protein NusG [Capsulimonas corticalis]BDI33258.1 transcription termination/antitermination protein NusG [Capsulimonas corticalis]
MLKHWYAVHTYSGHEKKVKTNIERRADTMGLKGKVYEILVPTEKETRVRAGKKSEIDRKVFPGYVFIEMILDDNTWYLVKSTTGVIGFVGDAKPTPVKNSEIAAIRSALAESETRPLIRPAWSLGQAVRVMSGPFADFTGSIQEINAPKDKVKVLISIFGRDTPVELEFSQIEKIS